jgi:hypothetical protein
MLSVSRGSITGRTSQGIDSAVNVYTAWRIDGGEGNDSSAGTL